MKRVETAVYAFIVLLSCVMMFIPATASAQPAMTGPTPGTTLSGSTVTFTWTAGGTSVDEWWLYVGTSAGGADIDDSGSLGLNTSETVSGLPTDGSTVHVRLWYRQGSSWPFVDFQYTASGSGGGTLEITSPVPGSTLSGSSETFTWTAGGTSVDEWWLYVGTSVGGTDIDDSGSLGLNTSTTVSGLPTDGSTVHVRLWYRQGSSWPYVDFQYTASGSGGGTLEITSPVNGSTFSGSTVTFAWTAGGTPVDEWWLNVGTSAGGTDIDDSGSLGLNTSTTVSGLPTDGSTVHVRLWYRQGASWPYVDFQYTASGDGGGGSGTIEMTGPVPGSTLSGSTVTFTWTAGGTSVDEWWLNVGTSVGGFDLDTGSVGLNTSKTVSGLPTNGSTVYVRLEYRQGSSWQSMDYQYTASGTGGGGTIRMLSPAPGSTLSWNTETFTWTAGGTPVTEWFLYVGSVQGSDDIYHHDAWGGTSATVYDIPNDGSTIYVRLWYETRGRWGNMDYQYTANADGGGGPRPLAYITSPAANSTLACSQTFSWNDNGNPATDHWLDIGSYPYGKNLWESGSLGTSRSVTVSGLPAGITVYVRLSYFSRGSWHFTPNYAYTTPSGGC